MRIKRSSIAAILLFVMVAILLIAAGCSPFGANSDKTESKSDKATVEIEYKKPEIRNLDNWQHLEDGVWRIEDKKLLFVNSVKNENGYALSFTFEDGTILVLVYHPHLEKAVAFYFDAEGNQLP